MQRIFYENSYKKEFVAEIIEIKEIDNKFHIVLDKTNLESPMNYALMKRQNELA